MEYFIYTTKLSKIILVVRVFRNYLHKRMHLEKQIALTKNKLESVTILEHVIFYSYLSMFIVKHKALYHYFFQHVFPTFYIEQFKCYM